MGPSDQCEQSNQRHTFQSHIWSRCSIATWSISQVSKVAHFDLERQAEARELDSVLLEERRNMALINVRKYQESLKKYYNKSVVQWELNVGDLVLKKDIHTRDKHKFLSPWEDPFVIVDVAASGAYELAEVDDIMLPNTWNVDQLHKYIV
jgi:hypothetical protein